MFEFGNLRQDSNIQPRKKEKPKPKPVAFKIIGCILLNICSI